MLNYDPKKPPDPKEWLDLDEGERTDLICDYHDAVGEELPNPQLHAALHCIVENQIAMGEEVPSRTLRRLVKEGLDRHEAIHAVASVLADQMYQTMSKASPGTDMNERYKEKLESLTAEKWGESA